MTDRSGPPTPLCAPTGEGPGADSLPQSLIDAALKCSDLVVESDHILFSVEQGYSPFATVAINHWIAVRNGFLVMEVNLTQRMDAQSEDWMGSDKFAVSEPLTEAQALQVIDYWKSLASQADRLASAERVQAQARLDALGPEASADPKPWEVEARGEGIRPATRG